MFTILPGTQISFTISFPSFAKLVNDNKEEEEPVETTEAVVDEHTESTEIQDIDTPIPTPEPLAYEIGSTITMGTYNGEDITWIVLDEEDEKYENQRAFSDDYISQKTGAGRLFQGWPL